MKELIKMIEVLEKSIIASDPTLQDVLIKDLRKQIRAIKRRANTLKL